MHHLYQPIIDWYLGSLQTGGYPLIVLLMVIESTAFPLPSEFVIPPAAYLAHSQGSMSVVGVVLAGALGSWIGATIMYWAARWAGRPLVLRFGRWFWISPEQVLKAERWSERFGSFGVFFSRMLPVVRHLIGIPSGIVRLNFLKYSLYTAAGSSIWCAVLAAAGVYAGGNEKIRSGDVSTISLTLAAAAAVLGALYYFFVYRITKAEQPAA
jgi:membrane protein DedA with SNARE-associated domain